MVGLLRGVFVLSEDDSFLTKLTDITLGSNGQIFIVSNNGWLLEHSHKKENVADFGKYDYNKYVSWRFIFH